MINLSGLKIGQRLGAVECYRIYCIIFNMYFSGPVLTVPTIRVQEYIYYIIKEYIL